MKNRFWMLAAAVVLAVAAVSAVRWTNEIRQLRSLPQVDLSRLHAAAQRAIHDAEQTVRTAPRSSDAWGRLGMVYMAHDCPREALACFSVTRNLDDQDFRWWYLSGVILEQSDFTAARNTYAQAERLAPRYAPLLLRLSTVTLALGEVEAAGRYAAAAAEAAPTRAFPCLQLGRIERLSGNLREAAVQLDKAVQHSPVDRQARLELANVYFLLGDHETALRLSQEAEALADVLPLLDDPVLLEVQRLDSTARQAAERADALAAAGQIAAAADLYRILIHDYPELSGPRLSRANLLLHAGQSADAEREFRELLERFPDEVLGYYGLAFALQAAGDRDGARSAFEACLSRKPDFAEAHLSLGLLQQQTNEFDSARASFQRALTASPDLAAAHLALGHLMIREQKWDEGIRQLEIACRLDPNDPIGRRLLENAQRTRAASQ